MKRYLILLLLILPFSVLADDINGSFVPPTERIDNTPLSASEIGGYNVYVDGIKDLSISPLPAGATSFSLIRPGGNYLIAITTLDTDGRESEFSEVIDASIPFAPMPPSNITITISI